MNIYYSNPWSSSKNMGGAINAFCRIVPNGSDWIIIQDGDICYLTPDWGNRIEQALQLDGDKFGLVGCYTNRLAANTQLHLGRFSENMNIPHHYNIAAAYNGQGIEALRPEENIAGLFMAFRKEVWEQVGGFREKTPCFDTFFSRAVKECGHRIGLIRSLYVFHAYRPWSRSPRQDNKHLFL